MEKTSDHPPSDPPNILPPGHLEPNPSTLAPNDNQPIQIQDNLDNSTISHSLPPNEEEPFCMANIDNVPLPDGFFNRVKSVQSLPIDEAMSVLFPLKSTYPSQKVLKGMVNAFGGTRGFNVSIKCQTHITCSRYGTHTKKESKKSQAKNRNDFSIIRRRSTSVKCGCTFEIQHSKNPVTINEVCYSHSNGCNPSPDELVAV